MRDPAVKAVFWLICGPGTERIVSALKAAQEVWDAKH